MKLVVVAPVYNEEEGITLFHARTRAVLDTLEHVDAHILFVVDRCRDGTVGKLREVVARDARARVLTLSSRFGHQASLMAGIEASQQADAIVMMDSDLQHPPELIPEMLRKFREGFDVVYTLRRDSGDVSFVRRRLGALFYRFIKMVSSVDIKANAADFRLISQRVAVVLANRLPERNLFLRGLVAWVGFRQYGLDFVALARSSGTSKYNTRQTLRLALAGILSFSTKPLQLGIYLGLGFSATSFLYALYLVVKFFTTSSVPSGWTTLTVLVLLAAGVQLVVIGVMGLYIGGIYEQVRGRPRYIIEEEISHGGP